MWCSAQFNHGSVRFFHFRYLSAAEVPACQAGEVSPDNDMVSKTLCRARPPVHFLTTPDQTEIGRSLPTGQILSFTARNAGDRSQLSRALPHLKHSNRYHETQVW